MKLYFDNCCYGRPFDDQADNDIREDTAAIQNIVMMAQWYRYTIFGSKALDFEIGRIKNSANADKYTDIWKFYQTTITARALLKKNVFDHFAPLAKQANMRGLDVFHLCNAISAEVDYLVTTDKKFIKAANRMTLPVKVVKPLNFPLGGVI